MTEETKKNEQLPPDDKSLERINEIIVNALRSRAAFIDFALPRKIQPVMISRYREGMYYNRHLDSPLLSGSMQLRSDLSLTLFLNDPDCYKGGDLVLETDSGEQRFRLPAGGAIVYDTGVWHRVSEVIEGERMVAITWIQSMVRDPAKRLILQNMNSAHRQVMEVASDSEVADLLRESYVNLMRMWAET